MKKYSEILGKIVRENFDFDGEFSFERTDEKFGDFATNAAMVIFGFAKKNDEFREKYAEKNGKDFAKNPRELAEEIREKLLETGVFASVEIAGPGFLNMTVSARNLRENLDETLSRKPQNFANQVVLTEFSDPNPFKVLHIGHLYTSIIGDSVSRLIENAGGKVSRLNFGGDVGLHVAKNLYAIAKNWGGNFDENGKLDQDFSRKLSEVPEDANERANFMAKHYVEGTNAYEDDDAAHETITKINAEVYRFHRENDHESNLAKIYWTCREWSYDYFNDFYAKIGVNFAKYYPESQTEQLGLREVLAHVPEVYQKSDQSDAIIFPGEKYGLHTRVFVNSNGLPTYEAKDVGLSLSKWRDYHFDRSFIITGNDILEYMKVVVKSISLFAPEPAERTTHITHGNVKLAGGVKMSSRKGNFVRAVDVLDLTTKLQAEVSGTANFDVALGALKFGFLKSDIGPDVVFEPETSVSLTGFSGPYVQYAAVRINKILADNGFAKGKNFAKTDDDYDFAPEKNLLLKLTEYPSVLAEATDNLKPHKIAEYAFELAKTLNKYYEQTPVATAEVTEKIRENRLEILAKTSEIFANALEILGMKIPEKM